MFCCKRHICRVIACLLLVFMRYARLLYGRNDFDSEVVEIFRNNLKFLLVDVGRNLRLKQKIPTPYSEGVPEVWGNSPVNQWVQPVLTTVNSLIPASLSNDLVHNYSRLSIWGSLQHNSQHTCLGSGKTPIHFGVTGINFGVTRGQFWGHWSIAQNVLELTFGTDTWLGSGKISILGCLGSI